MMNQIGLWTRLTSRGLKRSGHCSSRTTMSYTITALGVEFNDSASSVQFREHIQLLKALSEVSWYETREGVRIPHIGTDTSDTVFITTEDYPDNLLRQIQLFCNFKSFKAFSVEYNNNLSPIQGWFVNNYTTEEIDIERIIHRGRVIIVVEEIKGKYSKITPQMLNYVCEDNNDEFYQSHILSIIETEVIEDDSWREDEYDNIRDEAQRIVKDQQRQRILRWAYPQPQWTSLRKGVISDK